MKLWKARQTQLLAPQSARPIRTNSLPQKDQPSSTECRNPIILASPMNPLLKIMAHLRTARRELQSTSLHEQTATAAILPTLNNETEHLLSPDTTCTGCRSEQKELQPSYSILHTIATRTTAWSSNKPVRCWDVSEGRTLDVAVKDTRNTTRPKLSVTDKLKLVMLEPSLANTMT